MEKRMLLYPILAVLLGISIVALPRLLMSSNSKEVGTPLTTFSKNVTEAQETNKSRITTTS
ncbi:MAG: hypothetical protein HA495_02150, partial [Thaumarchaeota archaeon]|nr:hypothetical protein [Nitrososphaerota archaeon]